MAPGNVQNLILGLMDKSKNSMTLALGRYHRRILSTRHSALYQGPVLTAGTLVQALGCQSALPSPLLLVSVPSTSSSHGEKAWPSHQMPAYHLMPESVFWSLMPPSLEHLS